MNRAKRVFCILILVVCLSLGSCKNEERIKYPLIGDRYTLTKEGDTVYFNFVDETLKPSATLSSKSIVRVVFFSSMQEMYTKITTFQLTEDDLLMVKYFPREKKGIPIVDVNALYAPTHSEALHVRHVEWRGESYKYQFSLDTHSSCKMIPCSRKAYLSLYAKALQDIKRKDFEKIESVQDRNAVEGEYQTPYGGVKFAWYTLSRDNKIFHVIEEYFIPENDSSMTNSRLTYLKIYGEDDGNYFYVELKNLAERPTEEWLLSFGLEPFVPEDAA